MADSASARYVAKHAPIHSLTIATLFSNLSEQEQLYAHHMSRWVALTGTVLMHSILTAIEEHHGMVQGSFCDRLHQKLSFCLSGSSLYMIDAMVFGLN